MTYMIGRDLMREKMQGFDAWDEELSSIANMGYTFCVNITIHNPEFVYHTYPVKWSQYYQKHWFTLRDPVLLWASVNDGKKRWSAIPGLDDGWITKRVMEVARTFGINYGAVCVTRNNEPHRRKCFLTAARHDRELTDNELERMWKLFLSGLESLTNNSGLTRSEVEVLQLLATGYTQDEIAMRLLITRDAVKKRIERARQALKAKNAIHAVTIGIARGVVDVWKIEAGEEENENN